VKIRAILGATILLVSGQVGAAVIGASSETEGDGFFVYGQYWTNFTSALTTASGGSLVTGVDVSNLSDLMIQDAVLLNLRPSGSSLTATETTNLLSFIDSGGKLLMFGENNGWPIWNQSILDLVGGVNGNYEHNGNTGSIVDNDLTAGVDSVYVPYAGIVSSGGQALFDQNFATLWDSNVLTILDVNVLSDAYWTDADNAQFAINVANWLASPSPSPIPIPAAVWLFGTGILGLIGFSKRKRKAA
jgi:hypothetical protein